MQNRGALSSEEKRAALNKVLQSDTFARADQLKSFLRYVCEQEIAGEGAKITEYLIGVEALGRSEGFSPNDDTSVRNRAYALRRKLEKFYEEECPSSEIRIEFLKGTYIPRFVVNGPEAERPAKDAVAEPISTAPEPSSPDETSEAARSVRKWAWLPVRYRIALALAAPLLAGVLIGAFAARRIGQQEFATAPSVAPVLREAWGPLLGPHADVMLCVAAAVQLTVLPMDFKLEWSPPLPTFEAPAAIYPWYGRYHPLESGTKLFLTPNANSPHFGDVLGAMGIARVMTAAGAPFQFLPERLVPSATLNDRNVVLFGVPYKSEAVSKLLETGRFEFKYDPALRDIFLSENTPGNPAGRRFVPRRDESSSRIESFGLITVRPSPGVEGGLSKTAIFSGDPSAGAAAAADYFSSPTHMRDLKQRFAKQGYSHFPPSYQVVVRCRVDSNLPTAVSYETHVVLP
jgi:hypothetical protein